MLNIPLVALRVIPSILAVVLHARLAGVRRLLVPLLKSPLTVAENNKSFDVPAVKVTDVSPEIATLMAFSVISAGGLMGSGSAIFIVMSLLATETRAKLSLETVINGLIIIFACRFHM